VTDTAWQNHGARPIILFMPVYWQVSMGTNNEMTDLDGDSAHGLVVGGHIEKDSDHFVAFLFRRKG
jgi:hypothetical protein